MFNNRSENSKKTLKSNSNNPENNKKEEIKNNTSANSIKTQTNTVQTIEQKQINNETKEIDSKMINASTKKTEDLKNNTISISSINDNKTIIPEVEVINDNKKQIDNTKNKNNSVPVKKNDIKDNKTLNTSNQHSNHNHSEISMTATQTKNNVIKNEKNQVKNTNVQTPTNEPKISLTINPTNIGIGNKNSTNNNSSNNQPKKILDDKKSTNTIVNNNNTKKDIDISEGSFEKIEKIFDASNPDHILFIETYTQKKKDNNIKIYTLKTYGKNQVSCFIYFWFFYNKQRQHDDAMKQAFIETCKNMRNNSEKEFADFLEQFDKELSFDFVSLMTNAFSEFLKVALVDCIKNNEDYRFKSLFTCYEKRSFNINIIELFELIFAKRNKELAEYILSKSKKCVFEKDNNQAHGKKIMELICESKALLYPSAVVDVYKDFIKTGFFPLDECNEKIVFTNFDPKDEKQIVLNKIISYSFSCKGYGDKDLISAVICSLGAKTKQCYFDALVGSVTEKTYFGEHQIKIVESLLDQHGSRFSDESENKIKKTQEKMMDIVNTEYVKGNSFSFKKSFKLTSVPNNPYDIVIQEFHLVQLEKNPDVLTKVIRYLEKTAPEKLYDFVINNKISSYKKYEKEFFVLEELKLEKSVNEVMTCFKEKHPRHVFSISFLMCLTDEQLIDLCKHETKNLFANNVKVTLSTIFDVLNFYSIEFIQSSNIISELKRRIKILFDYCPVETYLLMQRTQPCGLSCDRCNKSPSHGIHTFLDLIFSNQEKNELLKTMCPLLNTKVIVFDYNETLKTIVTIHQHNHFLKQKHQRKLLDYSCLWMMSFLKENGNKLKKEDLGEFEMGENYLKFVSNYSRFILQYEDKKLVTPCKITLLHKNLKMLKQPSLINTVCKKIQKITKETDELRKINSYNLDPLPNVYTCTHALDKNMKQLQLT